jgi:HemK-like putative methylase
MYTISLNTEEELGALNFATRDDVFVPTATSKVLIDASLDVISVPKKILDLGCGSGVVGIALARAGLCEGLVYASDLSRSAVELARENAREHGVKMEARSGSLFKPWSGEKFDFIIDDVAGISDDIADRSTWYPDGVSCDAGRDGTKWIVRIIEQSSEFLANNGALIFPVISLSNRRKILDAVNDNFKSFELIKSQDWFLPDDISENNYLISSLLEDGSIECKERFGKWVCSTSVYVAKK